MKSVYWILPLLLWACGTAADEDPRLIAAPQFGAADTLGGDVADTECRVVVRSVARVEEVDPDPSRPSCFGNCAHQFVGSVDIRRELGGETAANMLYRSMSGELRAIDVDRVEGAVDGFSRFAFTFVDVQPFVPPGSSATPKLEIMVYVDIDGVRHFDRNGPVGARTLDAARGWSFTQRPEVCPAADAATLRFQDDWAEVQDGRIVPGGALTIEYDIDRLPHCSGQFHNGRPAWQFGVTMKFPPSGQRVRRTISTAQGAEIVGTPTTVYVPPSAEVVEMWFDTSGAECPTHYDSNEDRNYVFSVEPRTQ